MPAEVAMRIKCGTLQHAIPQGGLYFGLIIRETYTF